MNSRFFVLAFIFALPLFGDQFFTDKLGREIRLAEARSPEEIVLDQGKDILVKSFMNVYEDVPLDELNPNFKCIGDVRRFYEDYFESELGHFKKGELYWIQAFDGDELVGWATFQPEAKEDDAIYMNLLVMDPKHQRRGIGEKLVFSIRSEELFPNTKAINLLIRKVNETGRIFYQKIGFVDFAYPDAQDNFVDMSLLTGLRWEVQP